LEICRKGRTSFGVLDESASRCFVKKDAPPCFVVLSKRTKCWLFCQKGRTSFGVLADSASAWPDQQKSGDTVPCRMTVMPFITTVITNRSWPSYTGLCPILHGAVSYQIGHSPDGTDTAGLIPAILHGTVSPEKGESHLLWCT